MNIYGSARTDFLYGTDSFDMLVGLEGNDYLYGFDGDDLFIGGWGADVLYGGDAYGRDTGRHDMAAYWDSPSGVHVDLTTGRGYGGTAQGDRLIGIEGLRGSEYDDWLGGNAEANDLDGGGGNDILIGLGGDDDMAGGFGNDILF